MKSVSAHVSGVKSSGVRVAAALLLSLPLAAGAQGLLGQKKGQGGSEIQGSAGPGGSQGANGLEHCDKPMGAIAVVEPQDYVSQSLSRYGLQSPTGLIRMMVQQSNCFIVVERGIGMQNMMQERALQESGELRQNSNMGGGQMVSADFVLTPAVVFSENDAGGMGGALGGLLPGSSGRVLGAVAGGLKFKEAQTSMLVTDSRTGVQVASAEGSSKKADLKLGGLAFGGGAAGALGGYTKTNEGKVIAASLMDNYNNIVRSVRSQPSLQRDVGTLAEEAGRKTKGGAVFNEGDTIVPKLGNLKVYASASDSSPTVATLAKGEEMIFMGEEQDGYLKIESSNGGGWVKKVLVTR
ncbi:SH3 domain-containing protein [Steroidobacter sp. S1-65]|uniref:SH3 domain-containing protein n=1 Tax=Steroidobacter gossypii TaxID=2805490 RepID=A0ABS1WTR5_9GAMM|nr:SH3 domain-containing protein [Steroidobacter gossypii]MBM0104379.1 SH3 domain-containing protein [Steroidobacter gossypii]